jgi:hypothetical protein
LQIRFPFIFGGQQYKALSPYPAKHLVNFRVAWCFLDRQFVLSVHDEYRFSSEKHKILSNKPFKYQLSCFRCIRLEGLLNGNIGYKALSLTKMSGRFLHGMVRFILERPFRLSAYKEFFEPNNKTLFQIPLRIPFSRSLEGFDILQ